MHKRICLAVAFMFPILLADSAEAVIEATAIAGRPFGVAAISLPAGGTQTNGNRAFYRLSDEEGRTFYPVFATGPGRRILSGLLGIQGNATNVRLFFLFKGDAPLSVVLHTPEPTNVVVVPQQSTRSHARVLQQWWREYHAEARIQKRQGDYPPVLQDYLVNMLGRRLRLSTPLLGRIADAPSTETQETLDLLLGVESLRSATMARTMRGEREIEVARQAFPVAPSWPKTTFTAPAGAVDIEPLAKRTPRECFYVRFGSFANFLWLEDLADSHGGDLSRMAMLRGQNNSLSARVQSQLALKKTALSELLGGQVIEDMAVIGQDAFVQDGAAIGVLFQARSNVLLANNLAGLRAEALVANRKQGAKIQDVKIAGGAASLLSTPDNGLHSFYVTDGQFHLVTNSQNIAERFLAADEEKTTLGDTAEFLDARFKMPTSRGDTVFIYASQTFLQGLVSPQYQIELQRRLEATTDMQLLDMARLAARNEGASAVTIDQYIEQGFLPPGFGQRSDGSGLVASDDDAIDSLRGRRGSFLPTPDIKITSVTAQEAADYVAKAASYQENWKQFDPIMIGIRREPMEGNRERLTIDGRISSIDETKYGWLLSILGPPNHRRVAPAPGDIINIQASLQGGLLTDAIPPHQLFLGIQDTEAFITHRPDSLLRTIQIIASAPGYLGSWPKAGYLDWLPLEWVGVEPDVFGYTQLPLGLWRRQWDAFSALSFQRDVLERATPGLKIVEDPTSAQVRIRVGDLSTAKIRNWINQLYFDRAKQTTNGNLMLIHATEQQLGIEAKDAKDAIERIIDAELICTLGGKYALAGAGLDQHWMTTSLDSSGQPVEKFDAPIMSWFRGLQAHLTRDGDDAIVRGELIMTPAPAGIPGLGPILKALGGQPAEKKPSEKKPSEEKPGEKKPAEKAGRDF